MKMHGYIFGLLVTEDSALSTLPLSSQAFEFNTCGSVLIDGMHDDLRASELSNDSNLLDLIPAEISRHQLCKSLLILKAFVRSPPTSRSVAMLQLVRKTLQPLFSFLLLFFCGILISTFWFAKEENSKYAGGRCTMTAG